MTLQEMDLMALNGAANDWNNLTPSTRRAILRYHRLEELYAEGYFHHLPVHVRNILISDWLDSHR